jgi:hypothetical protein
VIDQTAQLRDLPAYWQEQIRKLRSENRSLRQRLKSAIPFEDLVEARQLADEMARQVKPNGTDDEIAARAYMTLRSTFGCGVLHPDYDESTDF